MADDQTDDADKTEAPTPRRLEKAREDGTVARSQDLVAAILILCAAGLLWASGGHAAGVLGTLTRRMIGSIAGPSEVPDLPRLLIEASVAAGYALAPLWVGIVLAAVLASGVQTGFLTSSKKIKPDLANLSPMKGVKRLFGSGRGPVQLGLSIGKLLGVTAAAGSVFYADIGRLISLQQASAVQGFGGGVGLLFDVMLRIGVVLLVLALLDYLYQRYVTSRKLRMTKEEVKREMKEMEIDPHLKQRRRQIALQRMKQRVDRDVPRADVVVTNPTHFAVALKYDESSMGAPKVVAKGADFLAQRIRELAATHGVPIVERKPLARALYKVDVGREVPEELYGAVAEILAYVYELNGRAAAVR